MIPISMQHFCVPWEIMTWHSERQSGKWQRKSWRGDHGWVRTVLEGRNGPKCGCVSQKWCQQLDVQHLHHCGFMQGRKDKQYAETFVDASQKILVLNIVCWQMFNVCWRPVCLIFDLWTRDLGLDQFYVGLQSFIFENEWAGAELYSNLLSSEIWDPENSWIGIYTVYKY